MEILRVSHKNAVLVCGNTGAGKRTLVNYLVGSKLKATKDKKLNKLIIESSS